MLLIDCPFCGPRNESEFSFGGPALTPRPSDPAAVSDADWVDWLTVPPNPMGLVEERWWHARGCGSWLTICRHTVTHEITEVRLGR
ncbi:sarcosine oxidase subunit delta [Defluviimonas aestuarii]|uniref:sarcosine oxidase subunit delta n=1 Tax=Albidovulum aestuarii TaxID=1130726 RepID=UPI00249A91EC|nr:sarcosine oxidase subunit delta [Defluviimonas aestuarii]MDI3336409.1 sarcosine oxidase subunit delta [Defluviimonas aestuarii]